jgi:hypothetical protein
MASVRTVHCISRRRRFSAYLDKPGTNTDGTSDPLQVQKCEVNALCNSCKRIFSKSAVLQATPTQDTWTNEGHKLYHSLEDFDTAVRAGCFFCIIIADKVYGEAYEHRYNYVFSYLSKPGAISPGIASVPLLD